MFKAITRGISITVRPNYLTAESDPDERRFLWAYHVEIENNGPITVQLLSRRWVITDATGLVREVNGPGVVGLQPVLRPGERFDYTSGCPLTTPSGIMVGHYLMVTELGETFQADIPAFSLDSPEADRILN